MALIKCPECGRMVSDMAAACPQCGYPISSALKQRNTGAASGLQIPTPIRKAAYMQSYIETISENERTVDNAFRHDKAIRKIVDGQKCVLTPLYHCYLYRNAALRDGFFIVGAALTIDQYMFYQCLEQNPLTGKLKTFWVGGRDRIEDGSDLEGDLNYHMVEMIPNWKAWLMDYISTET